MKRIALQGSLAPTDGTRSPLAAAAAWLAQVLLAGVARRIVAIVVSGIVLLSVAAPVAAAEHGPAPVQAQAVAQRVAGPSAAAQPVAAAKTAPRTYVVRARTHDTLWRIADRRLGDGARWPEIYTLNKGRRQHDGHRLTTPHLIRPGWVLRLPARTAVLRQVTASQLADAALALEKVLATARPELARVTLQLEEALAESRPELANSTTRLWEAPAQPTHAATYVVRADAGRERDTLWGIAARTLADPDRWREIYALNKGHPQPDGGRLTRPDLIRPGWRLLLPTERSRTLAGMP